MKIRKNALMLTAAFTGLLAGTMSRLSAAVPASGNSNPRNSSGTLLASSFAAKDDKKADKKTDKDKNSCKGKGGCGSDTSKKDKSSSVKAGASGVRYGIDSDVMSNPE